MFHERLTANALGQTLAYAEAICPADGFLRHHYSWIDRKARRAGETPPVRDIDIRVIVARLIDMGAPIADWRNDPRVFVPTNVYRVRPTDMFGNLRGDWAGDVYAGEEAETLRGIRREYEKRLIDWLFADKPPVPPKSDEFRVCSSLISWMPSVEEFVDAALCVEVAA